MKMEVEEEWKERRKILKRDTIHISHAIQTYIFSWYDELTRQKEEKVSGCSLMNFIRYVSYG